MRPKHFVSPIVQNSYGVSKNLEQYARKQSLTTVSKVHVYGVSVLYSKIPENKYFRKCRAYENVR